MYEKPAVMWIDGGKTREYISVYILQPHRVDEPDILGRVMSFVASEVLNLSYEEIETVDCKMKTNRADLFILSFASAHSGGRV
jgi:hypothetical protein